jgi:hypothetical protein
MNCSKALPARRPPPGLGLKMIFGPAAGRRINRFEFHPGYDSIRHDDRWRHCDYGLAPMASGPAQSVLPAEQLSGITRYI